ncbi:acyl-CoA thioesterase [Sphingobium sufflavum]|uniref:acyl-CoA thioesterase n=1 Tax=Sphingobium sufflavum TaxID=1129547 RepID=UPI001F22E2F1|nr:acyl-CoA thioesterase [Sphingobium sufflavum]MCE7795233.1 acyl-CoA thioesterase [Sphingobium sufflavum]
MARPSPWMLNQDTYPYSVAVPPRYADLDPMGHINNVAIASMFETGRVNFHQQLQTHPREQGVRWLVAAVAINYLEEMHMPDDITIASGLRRIGNRSWTISSAAFQNGECCATCETVMVVQGGGEDRGMVTDELRTRMRPFFVAAPEGDES